MTGLPATTLPRAVTMQAGLAWALVGLCVVFGVVHTWLFLGWSETRDDTAGWPILTVGAVLLAKDPNGLANQLFKLGRLSEARTEFERAAEMTRNQRERELLLERAAACSPRADS